MKVLGERKFPRDQLVVSRSVGKTVFFHKETDNDFSPFREENLLALGDDLSLLTQTSLCGRTLEISESACLRKGIWTWVLYLKSTPRETALSALLK